MGLTSSYGLDQGGVQIALDRGLNYMFAVSTGRSLVRPLREACARDRASVVIATGPPAAFAGWNLTLYCEAALRRFRVEQLDVLHLFWLGVASAWTEGTVSELRRLKGSGKVRAIGLSTHDRPGASPPRGRSTCS